MGGNLPSSREAGTNLLKKCAPRGEKDQEPLYEQFGGAQETRRFDAPGVARQKRKLDATLLKGDR